MAKRFGPVGPNEKTKTNTNKSGKKPNPQGMIMSELFTNRKKKKSKGADLQAAAARRIAK